MWQTIDLTTTISPTQIDNQASQFNVSAWIGGYNNDNDNAVLYLTFNDQANQQVGNTISLGPVLSADR
ncbi:unnamed protein product, partial [Rotaria sp. Silwood1]